MEKIKDQIRQRDMFAVPINLKYKGNSSFQTIPGGFCSIIILVIISVLTYSELLKVYNRDFTYLREEKFGISNESSKEKPLDQTLNKIRIRFRNEGALETSPVDENFDLKRYLRVIF